MATRQTSSTSTSSSSIDSGGGPPASKKEGPIKNVKRSFRSFTSSLIVAVRQAEKVVLGDNADGKSSDEQTRLKEAVIMVLKQRQQLRATATLFEDKLRGNLKETQALHCSLKGRLSFRSIVRTF